MRSKSIKALVLGTLITGLVTIAAGSAGAQLQVTRGLLAPMRADSQAARGFLSRFDFWADVQHSGAGRLNAASWNYRMGAHVQLLTFGEAISIEGLLGHELYATPTNNIGFDPAGGVWEERLGVRWTNPAGAIVFEIFQRCRHEIDNGTPSSDYTGTADSLPTSRVVTLGGLRLTSITPELRKGRWSMRVQVEAEGYTASSDVRSPVPEALARRWDDAVALAGVTAALSSALGGGRTGYFKVWGSGMRFRSDVDGGVWQRSGRVEAGLRAAGSGGRGVSLFVAHEQTFDDVMSPVPQRFSGSFVGLRIGSGGVL
ncbi:MAG: hypothetical protein ACT4OZ_15140 [Gemmatimonadota bacterium]